MDNMLIFMGAYYTGADSVKCFICQKHIPEHKYAWLLEDFKSGQRVHLCDRHYKEWEGIRDAALESVAKRFQEEILGVAREET